MADYADDTQDDDTQQDDGSGAQALANAAPEDVDAHRNMIGEALQNLSDRGVDVEALAEKAGVSSADVNALDHDDLATMTQYIAQNHPQVMQEVTDRFPEAQGLLGMVLGGGNQGGGGGGFLGGLLSRFTGG